MDAIDQSADQNSLQRFFDKEDIEPDFRKQVIDILNKGADIPTFPSSLNRLKDVVNNPETTLTEISELIEVDVSLTTQFIRLSNSPFYRGQGEINSIRDALMRIGLNEVKNGVFAACLVSEFKKLKFPIDWATFWTHNLFVAKLTEKICDIYRPLEGGEYLAGLLHDVGKLVFMGHFPDQYQTVMEQVSKNGTTMFHEENRILTINHAQIGGALCSTWNVNTKVYEAIYYHHTPDEYTGDSFLAQCIYVADSLATMCHLNIHESKDVLEIDDINKIPAWTKLQENKPRRSIYLPLLSELSKAKEVAKAFF